MHSLALFNSPSVLSLKHLFTFRRNSGVLLDGLRSRRGAAVESRQQVASITKRLLTAISIRKWRKDEVYQFIFFLSENI